MSGKGFVPVRRGLLEHFSSLPANDLKVYLYLLLKAENIKKEELGIARVSYRQMRRDLRMGATTIVESIRNLERHEPKPFIKVTRSSSAASQTVFQILRFRGNRSENGNGTVPESGTVTRQTRNGTVPKVGTVHSQTGNGGTTNQERCVPESGTVKPLKRPVSSKLGPPDTRENRENRDTHTESARATPFDFNGYHPNALADWLRERYPKHRLPPPAVWEHLLGEICTTPEIEVRIRSGLEACLKSAQWRRDAIPNLDKWLRELKFENPPPEQEGRDDFSRDMKTVLEQMQREGRIL